MYSQRMRETCLARVARNSYNVIPCKQSMQRSIICGWHAAGSNWCNNSRIAWSITRAQLRQALCRKGPMSGSHCSLLRISRWMCVFDWSNIANHVRQNTVRSDVRFHTNKSNMLSITWVPHKLQIWSVKVKNDKHFEITRLARFSQTTCR